MPINVRDSLSKTRRVSDKPLSSLCKKIGKASKPAYDFSELWSASSFDLAEVAYFKDLNEEQTKNVLTQCSLMRLFEAYHIEHSGMSFTAKMSLLARNIEEQKLYSTFSAEEAAHLDFIEKSIGPDVEVQSSPFVELLHHVIAEGERMPLIFIIQVLLEGWGIDHYYQMSSTCLDGELQAHLKQILADEASHHGSGLILFDESELTQAEENFIVEIMVSFLEMVSVGPVGVTSILSENLGGFSKGQLDLVHTQMNAAKETTRKLSLLKKLMVKAQAHKIVERLMHYNSFTAAV